MGPSFVEMDPYFKGKYRPMTETEIWEWFIRLPMGPKGQEKQGLMGYKFTEHMPIC
jgi:hypothetical protein